MQINFFSFSKKVLNFDFLSRIPEKKIKYISSEYFSCVSFIISIILLFIQISLTAFAVPSSQNLARSLVRVSDYNFVDLQPHYHMD